ncbi:hypothetical protein IWW50_004465 [Coemansia erecta]|nr:hypothetical protein IWW50_004465 [Coemansia erecta]
MAFTETTGSNDDYKEASAEQMRLFYATKASVNPNLSTPSVPPSVSKVHADTVAQHGEDVASMAVSEYQGMLQNFFVGLLNAKRVLEIGTFTGASAIFFANALKRNGVAGGRDADGYKPVVSLDISEEFAKIARQNFVDAGVDDYIDVVVGDARQSLTDLAGQTFDIIFLDADKPAYMSYYEAILGKNMLAMGGLIIADNTAFNCVTPYIGVPAPVASDAVPVEVSFEVEKLTVLGPAASKIIPKALHNFNEHVRKDPRSEVVMLPLFTGISLIRLLPEN